MLTELKRTQAMANGVRYHIHPHLGNDMVSAEHHPACYINVIGLNAIGFIVFISAYAVVCVN